MIPGSQATAKLVAFQVNSGYDSYGKTKGNNAPISEEAEFAYTTALNYLLRTGSHNKFLIGTRTYLFWASSNSEASKASEDIFSVKYTFDFSIFPLFIYFNLLYSASLTSSSHSLELPSAGISIARCVNQLSCAAPCQCLTSAGIYTTSPGCNSCAGFPHS